MKILIDGDAFPKRAREVLLKASNRLALPLTFVSNKKLPLPASPLIFSLIVDLGFNEADNHLADMVQEGDLVITADIPLADRVVTKGGYALDYRGEMYTHDNIKSKLVMRNLMEELRDAGTITGGPSAYGDKDVRAFADALNRFLTKHLPKK